MITFSKRWTILNYVEYILNKNIQLSQIENQITF